MSSPIGYYYDEVTVRLLKVENHEHGPKSSRIDDDDWEMVSDDFSKPESSESKPKAMVPATPPPSPVKPTEALPVFMCPAERHRRSMKSVALSKTRREKLDAMLPDQYQFDHWPNIHTLPETLTTNKLRKVVYQPPNANTVCYQGYQRPWKPTYGQENEWVPSESSRVKRGTKQEMSTEEKVRDFNRNHRASQRMLNMIDNYMQNMDSKQAPPQPVAVEQDRYYPKVEEVD